MKWFKHYANAHTNKMIQALIAEKGLDYAMRYWLLIELLCSEFKKDTTVFHFSSKQLKDALFIKFDKKLATFAQLLTNFSATFDQKSLNFCQTSENFWKIETSILLDLMGKDFKRTRHDRGSDTPKKKEERRKKKEIRRKNTNTSHLKNDALEPEDIFKSWNSISKKNNGVLPFARSLSEKRKSHINSVMRDFEEMRKLQDWENYFNKIFSTGFLTGQNKNGWRADFDFVINKNNLLKIIEGKYDGQSDREKIDNLIENNPYRRK